jgi:hypothetical protein
LLQQFLGGWRTDVELAAISKWSTELAIDEDGAAGLLAARAQFIGGDEPLDDRLDREGFVVREELPGPYGRRWGADGAPSNGSHGSAPEIVLSTACAVPSSNTAQAVEANRCRRSITSSVTPFDDGATGPRHKLSSRSMCKHKQMCLSLIAVKIVPR